MYCVLHGILVYCILQTCCLPKNVHFYKRSGSEVQMHYGVCSVMQILVNVVCHQGVKCMHNMYHDHCTQFILNIVGSSSIQSFLLEKWNDHSFDGAMTAGAVFRYRLAETDKTSWTAWVGSTPELLASMLVWRCHLQIFDHSLIIRVLSVALGAGM